LPRGKQRWWRRFQPCCQGHGWESHHLEKGWPGSAPPLHPDADM